MSLKRSYQDTRSLRFRFLSSLFLLHLLTASAWADLSAGLIFHYPLDETSGDQARDVIGGAHASRAGGTRSPSWTNPGLHFDSSKQQAAESFEDFRQAPLREFYTFSAWIKSDSFSGNAFLSGNSYAVGIHQDGRVWFSANEYVGGEGSHGGGRWHSSSAITANEWNHITVTSDGHVIRFYINGLKDSEVGTRLILPSFPYTATSLGISFDSFLSPIYFNGTIRDVKIYGRAVSDTEAVQLAPTTLESNYIGLWLGHATINEVKQAQTDEWGSAPAFTQQVLLHIDTDGVPRLMREAILMKTRVTPPEKPEAVVMTALAELSNYDSVVKRGDHWIGQRFSSATMPMPTPTIDFPRIGGWYTASTTLGAWKEIIIPFGFLEIS